MPRSTASGYREDLAHVHDAGFRVRVLRTYGRTPFLPGVTGFLAEKPRNRGDARLH
jgi:hypothetical protein